MPLLRRQPFVKQKPPPNLRPDEELFHCPLTNELFRDYEQFFERIILCNSLVWTCSYTGRPGLTYQEALDSEERARKQLAAFPDSLQKPILYLSTLTQRSRLHDLNDDVFVFARDRYFVGETVEVLVGSEKKQCKIVKVIPPSNENGATNGADVSDSDSDCICLDDPEPPQPKSSPKSSPKKDFEKTKAMGADPATYQYVVQETKKNAVLITVKSGKINRKKGMFTRDKCKLYLKQHCDSSGDGIWRVKSRYIKRFKLAEVKFEDLFSGPTPTFVKNEPKKMKMPKKKEKGSGGVIDLTGEDEFIKQKKKEMKEQKQALKKKKQEVEQKLQEPKLTAEQIAEIKAKYKAEKDARKEELRKQWEEEKQRRKEEREKVKELRQKEKTQRKEEIKRRKQQERRKFIEMRAKVRQEEQRRLKLEKRQFFIAEREKKKEEKKQREEYLKSWSKPRDDMECDDLKDLPKATPVEVGIPTESFGDAVTLVEFLNSFSFLFDVEEELGGTITLERLLKSLQESEINNLYFDLVKFLLMAIFNLQEEEEEEEQELEQNPDTSKELKDINVENASHKELVRQATIAAQWPQLNYGTSLRQLDLDNFTVSEILRLHFLGSGSEGSTSDAKFRWQQRGGYVSSDDAGLEFRREQPELLQTLASGNLFDMSSGEKLKILNALINQLLTYVACRDFVEDNFEKLRQARYDLKQHQWTEQRRERDETTFWYKKRAEERRKEAEAEAERKAQKKKEREERLKIDELKKDAKAAGKNIRDYLKDEGHKELLERYDADQKEKEENNKEQKDPSPRKLRSKDPKPEEPERKSNRQKEAKEKAISVEDIPVENIEWDKVDPEERMMWKKLHEEKEKDMMDLINQLQRGHAIYPIGRDRTFRRYWVFNSLPGLFVEDDERYVPDDFFKPVDQTGASNPFNSEHLPLESKKPVQNRDEKSTSSDKENDSGSPEKNSSSISGDNTSIKPKVLTENNGVGESPMEVDDKSPSVPCVTVHDQIAERNICRWSYFNTPEQFHKLIDSLNPRGFREGPLKQSLLEQKSRILENMSKCPAHVLSISMEEKKAAADNATKLQAVRSQSRKKMLTGMVQNSSAQELMELNLREHLLDLEERICVGSIGKLEVNDRVKWRDAIENGNFDPQSDEFPSRTATPLKKMEVDGDVKKENDEEEADNDNGHVVAQDLSRALFQISKCIESKYLGPPLGHDENTKKTKALSVALKKFKKATPGKAKVEKGGKGNDDNDDSSSDSEDEENEITKKTALERWKDSLLASTNLSQVFLHLAVLDGCIVWGKSILHARCRLCRRKTDAEKMLLCDGCDRGHHIYCLKPPMKKIPEGDWFCNECKPKDIMKTPRKTRRQSSARDRDTEESESEEEDKEAEEDNNSASSEDEDDDNEEEADEDEDSEDDDSEDSSSDDSDEESEEEDKGPAKIKLRSTRRNLNFDKKTKSAPSSGRSTPTSVRSGRGSKPGTPRESTPELSTRSKRTSLNTGGDSSTSKKTGGRRSKETANTRRSAETAGRSVEKGKGRQSVEKTSTRRSAGNKRGRSSEPSEDEEDEEPATKKATTNSRGGEDADNIHKCEGLLAELMKHSDAWPFLRPVQKRDAPDYFDIIKTPMDFSTIKVKLNKFEYEDAADILEDLRLVFSNCEKYNVTTAEEYKAGQRLCRLFVGRVKELKLDRVLARKNKSKSDESGKDTSKVLKK